MSDSKICSEERAAIPQEFAGCCPSADRGIHNHELVALDHSFGMIESTPDGVIPFTNENFCKVLCNEAHDIIGEHRSLIVDPLFPKYADY